MPEDELENRQRHPTEKLLTTSDVAEILNISYNKARELMLSENLETVRISPIDAKQQTLRVTTKALNEFIEKGGCR